MAKSMAGSAPAAPTRSAKPFNSYLLNKCIVGYGIINGIINAVIFYLMHLSEPELLFSEADIFHDFALTGVLLGILLFVIVVPLTRMDLRKGCRHRLADGRRRFRLRASAAAAYRDGPYAAQGPCVRLRRGRCRVHHDLLRRALRQKRGLSGGLQSPGALLGTGGDRQSTSNRRSWETRDAPRLFFVSWCR